MALLQCGYTHIRPGFPLWRKQSGKLTAFTSGGPNWPYALVQFNGDTCHVPLPKEGHLCVLIEGGTNSTTCRQISQLEVCPLLHSHSQFVYPIGLNGCKAPMIVSLPESLARGANLLGGEPIFLKVSIMQSMAEVSKPKAVLSSICPSTLMASFIKATLLKVEEVVSMTTEVRELFTQEVLDTSGHGWTNSTLETKSHGCAHTSTHQTGRYL